MTFTSYNETILEEFMNYTPTKIIAKRHNLKYNAVRGLLRKSLGDENYLKITRRIGGKVTAGKLRSDSSFKKSYAANMSSSVKNSLRAKMEDAIFRKNWLVKARQASKKGNQKIRELMSEEEFFLEWKKKCVHGGNKCYLSAIGIHNPDNAENRREWSLKGLRNTGRKFIGPRGEHMYNALEVKTAMTLCSHGHRYVYEKIIKAKNYNRFFSIDFFVEGSTPLVIEATYWDDVKEKTGSLLKKFDLLKKLIPGAFFIIVTKPSMVHKYKVMLPHNIHVLDSHNLERQIAGKRGNNSNTVMVKELP